MIAENGLERTRCGRPPPHRPAPHQNQPTTGSLHALIPPGISDAASCRSEIEYLEEEILSQEEDANLLLIGGVVVLLRYCLFSLFDPSNTKALHVWLLAGSRQRLLS